MRLKHVLIVSLILTILTIGVASASENTTDVQEISDLQDNDLNTNNEIDENIDIQCEQNDDTLEQDENQNISHTSLDTLNSKKTTSIDVSNGIATLEDNEGNGLANQVLSFTIYKYDEDDNKKTYKFATVSTDNDGCAKIPTAGIPTGNYRLNIYFEGNDQYSSRFRITQLTVTTFEEDTLEINPNSLTALANLIEKTAENGILNLDADYRYVSVVNGASDKKEAIEITKTITINGNGHYIDGGNVAQIFKINANNVILKNIIFKNCRYYDAISEDYPEGGAVYWFGENGKILNCTFRDCNLRVNDSEGYEVTSIGGAVSWRGENGLISGSTFINNSALYGGAIKWEDDYCVIINCNFINNSAGIGGAISAGSAFQYDNQNGQIINCNFINCHANDGGAIELYYNNGNIIKCNFTNCQASRDGGAIYFEGNIPYVYESNFLNNNAGSGNSIYFTSGAKGEIINSNIKESDIYNANKFNIENIDSFSSTVESKDTAINYGNSYDFQATFLEIDGTALSNTIIIFKVGDDEYPVVTDSNGIATLKLGLKEGEYTITSFNTKTYQTKVNTLIVKSSPTDQKSSSQEQQSISSDVSQNNPAKTTLTLKTVKVKRSAKKIVISATLKVDGKAVKGGKITFKFNGKKYTAKTDKKGVAKITIKKNILKKLKVGKKVKYQASYGKVTVNKTVKVKK